MENNNYNLEEENSDEKKESNYNSEKINKDLFGMQDNKLDKNKKLKTVVLYLDKKFDLKNCFDKWNNFNKDSKNKIPEDLTDFDTINLEDKNNSNMNTKSSNNETKVGKKKRIKIKYVKTKSKDNNSINSSKSDENKISLSEEMDSSNDMNENKGIKLKNINETEEENKEMKSLEPKSTRKPFILRINKLEVKKKILKSNSKMKNDEKEDNHNQFMNLYSPLITTHFFQKWKQNKTNDIDLMQKIKRKFIIKSIVMNKKLNKFKTCLIKYIFKNK